MNLAINQNQLSDIYNIHYGVFKPLNKFVSKKEFVSIAKKMLLKNNLFFPVPVYFTLKTIPKNTPTSKNLNNFMIQELAVIIH